MAYNCVVCVKQVPDTKNITGEAMKEDGTINRLALEAIFNPEDMNALEAALAVRDEYGGSVTVVTMGMPKASDVLRDSIFHGADRVILITDRRAAASDTLATSYILSCAVNKLDADIVFCGHQAIDGDTAQVGPQLAEKLGVTLIAYINEPVKIDGKIITAKRDVGNGWDVVSGELPVLVTVMGSANVPRPPGVKRIMKYKRARCMAEVTAEIGVKLGEGASDDAVKAAVEKRCAELDGRGLLIEQWNLDDIKVDMDWCGMKGSPTKVNRIQTVVLAGGDYREYEPSDKGMSDLIGELIEDHTFG